MTWNSLTGREKKGKGREGKIVQREKQNCGAGQTVPWQSARGAGKH